MLAGAPGDLSPVPARRGCGIRLLYNPRMARAVAVHNLRKTYGAVVAVADVSFHVDEGEIFGIIGPNGSGKTTTVECLQGLRTRSGGEVEVLGLDPGSHGTQLRRMIGSQLQESNLPDRIKVWEALDLFAYGSGAGADWRELAERWGLTGKLNAVFASLSGGLQQRLFVALALVNAPRLVFLDEMTTGLDPSARRLAWELIAAVREHGATVVLVTHFMDEAEALCDRIAVFHRGRVVALDTPGGLVAVHGGESRVIFSAAEGDFSWLGSVPCVDGVSRRGARVEVGGRGAVLAHTAAALGARGIYPADLHVERSTLEDAFLKIVGAHGEQ